MPKNMGLIDKIVRIALAIGVAALLITGIVDGAAGIVLGILAAIFIVTSIVGTCPLYMPFKISTRGKKKA